MKTDSNNCYYSRSQCVLSRAARLRTLCLCARGFIEIKSFQPSHTRVFHLSNSFMFWFLNYHRPGIYGNKSRLKVTPKMHRDAIVHSNQKVIHFME